MLFEFDTVDNYLLFIFIYPSTFRQFNFRIVKWIFIHNIVSDFFFYKAMLKHFNCVRCWRLHFARHFVELFANSSWSEQDNLIITKFCTSKNNIMWLKLIVDSFFFCLYKWYSDWLLFFDSFIIMINELHSSYYTCFNNLTVAPLIFHELGIL